MSVSAMDKHLFNLKLVVKELERSSKRCEKEGKQEKAKTKQAILKGNMKVARIHAENAIRQKKESINYLKMSARVDAVASKIQFEMMTRKVTNNMTDEEHNEEDGTPIPEPRMMCYTQYRKIMVQKKHTQALQGWGSSPTISNSPQRKSKAGTTPNKLRNPKSRQSVRGNNRNNPNFIPNPSVDEHYEEPPNANSVKQPPEEPHDNEYSQPRQVLQVEQEPDAAMETSKGQPPLSPDLPKESPPRIVEGQLAICATCGYLSEDLNRCMRCKRKLPDNVKTITAINNNIEKKLALAKAKFSEDEEMLEEEEEEDEDEEYLPTVGKTKKGDSSENSETGEKCNSPIKSSSECVTNEDSVDQGFITTAILNPDVSELPPKQSNILSYLRAKGIIRPKNNASSDGAPDHKNIKMR